MVKCPAAAPEASRVNPPDLTSLLRKLVSLRKRKPVRADKVIGPQNSLIETLFTK